MFLMISAVMLWQTTNFLGNYTYEVKKISTVFSLSVLFILIAAVKNLPIDPVVQKVLFKDVLAAIIRRGIFIIASAILLSAYVLFYVIPLFE